MPICHIFAYSLLPNHFHLLLKIKDLESFSGINKGQSTEYLLHRAFSNLFISYAKSFNNAYVRHGRLFLQSFKRKLVEHSNYILILVNYIHRNPIHHGLTKAYGEWKYSSFNAYLSEKPTFIAKEDVLSYFSSKDEFIAFHEENKEISETVAYYLEK